MGGKSRKTGGVSQKLIQSLKNGSYEKNCCGKPKINEKNNTSINLFGISEEKED